MCTVTIFRSAERTLVTMNRDEARSRRAEIPPRLVEAPGQPAWLAPADGDKGGTWFGVNDQGMAAALLSAYVPGALALYGRDDVPSRGTIIPDLLGRDLEQAHTWIHGEFDPASFPSFTLVVASPGSAQSFEWRLNSGTATRPFEDGWSMVTSSLWRTDEVVPWRHRNFNRWLEEGAHQQNGIPTFNLLEVAGMEEWSPLTTRSFSITRRVIQAEIRHGENVARLRYWLRDHEDPIDPEQPTFSTDLALAHF